MPGHLQKTTPCLWFDDQAEEATEFYTSLFRDSKLGRASRYGKEGYEIHGRPEGSVMTVTFELAGLSLMALNGGPQFSFTPATSFFVDCETEEEQGTLWEALSEGGATLMPLQEYPFSEKFGWLNDRYGLSWQLTLSRSAQAISPFLMFVGEQHGKAEEAARFYASLFENSRVETIEQHQAGEGEQEGEDDGVGKLTKFVLAKQQFMALDGGLAHDFSFTEAVSFMVDCESQEEVDYFWAKLGEGGDERAQQCGWLKDRFGVSWQIVPTGMDELLGNPDSEKSERAMKAMLQMKKLDLDELRRAFDGS